METKKIEESTKNLLNNLHEEIIREIENIKPISGDMVFVECESEIEIMIALYAELAKSIVELKSTSNNDALK